MEAWEATKVTGIEDMQVVSTDRLTWQSIQWWNWAMMRLSMRRRNLASDNAQLQSNCNSNRLGWTTSLVAGENVCHRTQYAWFIVGDLDATLLIRQAESLSQGCW